MAGRSKNRLFSQFIRQLNEDLTVKTQGLTEESRLTNTSVDSKVDSAVADLISTAPETLNTLDELAAALGDDANFATTVTNSIATKANSADLATVATSGSYNDLSNKPSIPSISGLATTTYVDTAVAGAGSGDTIGTDTKSGSIITLDYSSGNAFDVDVNGGSGSNIIRLTNPETISRFRVKLNGTQSVDGAYGIATPIVSNGNTAFGASTAGTPYAMAFNPAGTKLYLGNGRSVEEFDLNTAWDPSAGGTSVTSKGYGSSYLSAYGGFVWKTNGLQMNLSLGGPSQANWRMTFNTAYSMASYSSGTSGANAFKCACSGGGYYFMVAYSGTYLYRKSDPEAGNWGISQTLTLSNIGAPATFQDIDISPDGTKIIGVYNNTVYLISMTTPYDLTTATCSSTSITGANGVVFNNDGSKFFTMDGSRNVYSYSPNTTIVQPAISFDTSGDSVTGSYPVLTNGGTSYMEVSTINSGLTYHVIAAASGSSSSGGGKVLGEYHSVCDGGALTDTVNTVNVTASQALTTTYVDVTGSFINGISVPSGTNTIIYEFQSHIMFVDAHGISHWKLFYSTDGSTWTEVTKARNDRAGYYMDMKYPLKWIFKINESAADTTVGKLTSTDTDTYYFKWQAREYSSSNEAQIHSTRYWNGGSTNQFSVPTVSIKCIS